MKRVIVLQIKDTKEEKTYSTCPELVVDNDKKKIGVGLGALWNALAKNNGFYENKKCKVFYRKIDNKQQTEWK